MPALPPELVETERLTPLSAAPSGQLVTIDKAQLDEIVTGYAAAIGAVERGNRRAVKVKGLWACTSAIVETGVRPQGC